MLEKPAQPPSIRDVVLTISPHPLPPLMSIVLGRVPPPLLLTLIQPSSEVDYTFASLPRLVRMVGGNNRSVVISSQKGGDGWSFLPYQLHLFYTTFIFLFPEKRVETFK